MNKIKVLTEMILLGFSLIISSCNIDDLPLPAIPEFQARSIEDLLFSNNNFGYNSLEVMEYTGNDSNLSYTIIASFYNNSYDYIDVGTLQIDTLKIKHIDSIGPYVAGYNFKLGDSIPIFGKQCNWGWTGNNSNGITPWAANFYSYKIINILNYKNGDTIDISKGIEIKWNPDLIISHNIPVLLKFGVYSWHTFVPDDGYFLIPDNVKKYISPMDSITISIGRVSNKLFEFGDRSCSLTASTICEKKIFVK